MKVFYSNDFRGVWPVGTSAIMVADDEAEARRFLVEVHPLAAKHEFSVHELSTDIKHTVLLQNGDY